MAIFNDVSSAGFPDQTASDADKNTTLYGNQVANFIANEWFYRDAGVAKFYDNREEMERLRLYARGSQNTAKYKRELAVDGDLSYLNLDWEPVPVIPKFVDLITNGIQDRLWDIRAYAQDEAATNQRKTDLKVLQGEMKRKQDLMQLQQQTGVEMFENDPNNLPESDEELEIFSQLKYKQRVEIAAETAINQVFDMNRYDQLRNRMNRDLTEIGMAVSKHSFDPSKGVAIEYVDPADMIYSYTTDPEFGDMYYAGEIKRVNIKDLLQMFPDLTEEQLIRIRQAGASHYDTHGIGYEQVQTERDDKREANYAEVLFFCWKTVRSSVYKMKEKPNGGTVAVKRDDQFQGPKSSDAKFFKSERVEEVVYIGTKVLGDDELLLKWEIEKNMVRPKASTHEVVMPFVISAPNWHRGRHDSMVKRITKYADMIQLTYLKIQQVLQKVVPPGVGINADALAEIDLGNGTAYDPREALNMFFQTGSVIYRTMDSEGAPLGNQLPITELPGSQGVQLQSLIGAQSYWYDQIRLATGINEARDASDPDPRALVGVQKMLAANSNVATRHILDSSLLITKKLAEAIALRMQDVLEYHPLKENFKMSIGRVNTAVLESLDGMHLHDFGIFMELEPDEEQKQFLEQNIQQALSQQMIHLDDAIDVRQIRNLKLANQMLKIRRQKKFKTDQEAQMKQQEAAAQSNGQAAQQAEQAKQQTLQMQIQADQAKEQAQTDNHIRKLEAEKEMEKEILQHKFELDMQMKKVDLDAAALQNDKNNMASEKQAKMKAGGGGGQNLGSKANTIDGKIKGRGFLQQ